MRQSFDLASVKGPAHQGRSLPACQPYARLAIGLVGTHLKPGTFTYNLSSHRIRQRPCAVGTCMSIAELGAVAHREQRTFLGPPSTPEAEH